MSYSPSKLAYFAQRLGSPRPQEHAPRGDRTVKFVLIPDRPIGNSHGGRSRVPPQFGGDQRPIGRMDFASFAMPAMPRHGSGLGADANRPGEVADFRVGEPPGTLFFVQSYF